MKSDVKETVELWQSWLENQQALDIKCLSMEGKSDLVDYMLVATALNTRHLAHLSEEAMGWAKQRDDELLAVDGLQGGNWVVMDFSHYMVHLFLAESRLRYDLEGLWEGNPRHDHHSVEMDGPLDMQ
ncbi:MAG: ribosome silencing factor [Planctomycetes bacterium]|nr:ribosome silencing factor [Planctomycetota bacterium]